MASVFTIKDGVGSSARGVEVIRGVRAEEKVGVIHAALQSGTQARTPLGFQPRKSLPSVICWLHYDWVWGLFPPPLWTVSFSKGDMEMPLSWQLLLFTCSNLFTRPTTPPQRPPFQEAWTGPPLSKVNESFPVDALQGCAGSPCCISAPNNRKLPESRTFFSQSPLKLPVFPTPRPSPGVDCSAWLMRMA